MVSFSLNKEAKKLINICRELYFFKATDENPKLSNLIQLTRSGLELLKFVNPKPHKEYINWSVEWFKTQGLELLNPNYSE